MTHTWSTKSPAARQSGSPGVEEIAPHIYQDAGIALARNTWGKGMESKSCDFSWNIAPAQWAARNSTTPPKPSTKPPAPWLSPVASRTTTPSKGSIYKAESLTSWKSTTKNCRPNQSSFSPLSPRNRKHRRANLIHGDSLGGILYVAYFRSVSPVYDPGFPWPPNNQGGPGQSRGRGPVSFRSVHLPRWTT